MTGCVLAFDEDDINIGHDAVARESVTFEVDVSGQKQVRLDAINGNVEITGRTGATSIVVSGEKQVGSNSIRDAEQRLDDLKVEVKDRADEIVIRTEQPNNTRGRNYVVNYTLTIPANLEVLVDLVNGNILVETLDNTISVVNTNGNVDLLDIQGSATVALTNGNIESEIVLPLDGTIDLTTTNGNIDLAIPSTTSATFSARLTNGRIDVSDLDLTDAVRSNRSLTDALGDSEGTITLQTVNGNVSVDGF